MSMSNEPDIIATTPLHARRTLIEDGRYLIYYTFGDAPTPPAVPTGQPVGDVPQPHVEPAATDSTPIVDDKEGGHV